MKIIYLTITLITIFILTGCATNKPTIKKYYSAKEYSKMTYCIGMSDTAMFVANKKLRHMKMDYLIDFYSKKKNSRLNIATVKKVYSENFKNSWDYTVKFFNECALNLAGVTAKRVNFASYCAQNTLIAHTAYNNKKSRRSKENTYKIFEKFNSKAPNKIIDQVYSSSKSRAEIKLDVWNNCMRKISKN